VSESDFNADDPIAVAKNLTESFNKMARQLSRLTKSERRFKLIAIGLVISLCIDFVVTFLVGYNTVRQNNTQNTSQANLVSACRQANANRTEDIAYNNRLLRLPATATVAQKAEVKDLEHLVAVKDRLRNCAVLYSTKK
jgi:hypothetical protein